MQVTSNGGLRKVTLQLGLLLLALLYDGSLAVSPVPSSSSSLPRFWLKSGLWARSFQQVLRSPTALLHWRLMR